MPSIPQAVSSFSPTRKTMTTRSATRVLLILVPVVFLGCLSLFNLQWFHQTIDSFDDFIDELDLDEVVHVELLGPVFIGSSEISGSQQSQTFSNPAMGSTQSQQTKQESSGTGQADSGIQQVRTQQYQIHESHRKHHDKHHEQGKHDKKKKKKVGAGVLFRCAPQSEYPCMLCMVAIIIMPYMLASASAIPKSMMWVCKHTMHGAGNIMPIVSLHGKAPIPWRCHLARLVAFLGILCCCCTNLKATVVQAGQLSLLPWEGRRSPQQYEHHGTHPYPYDPPYSNIQTLQRTILVALPRNTQLHSSSITNTLKASPNLIENPSHTHTTLIPHTRPHVAPSH